ncbi:hypothetical protein [Mesorhizobium sp. ES1-1]|uniref:hypothetical protein n=1 Tax=Mesorhizobium sp. ES1-1 TaxID=2876629 RepID=UPI001CCBF34B|nr:hypothetical protein [Mesorhizobium sp. ES1-1]MBZ9677607.1 hypothetical protein [Mesorhizobium sp. ES1-1]
MLMIAATRVLTIVVAALISAFWIKARHGLHDPTPDMSMFTQQEQTFLTWTP